MESTLTPVATHDSALLERTLESHFLQEIFDEGKPVIAYMEDELVAQEQFKQLAFNRGVMPITLNGMNEVLQMVEFYQREVLPRDPFNDFCIVLDINMSAGKINVGYKRFNRSREGINTLRKLERYHDRSFPVGILTAYSQHRREIFKVGVDFWFNKEDTWDTCIDVILDFFQARKVKSLLATEKEAFVMEEEKRMKRLESINQLGQRLDDLDQNKRLYEELIQDESFLSDYEGKYIAIAHGKHEISQEGSARDFFQRVESKYEENEEVLIVRVEAPGPIPELKTRGAKIRPIL